MPGPDLIEILLTAVKRHVPVPTEKEGDIHGALADALMGPFMDGQDLTAMDLNILHYRIEQIAALAVAVPTSQASEFSDRGWRDVVLEAVYTAVVRLPWFGAVFAVGLWAANRCGVTFLYRPWNIWLIGIGVTGLIDSISGTVWGSLRPRYAPCRWQLLVGPRGREVVFRRTGGQVVVAATGNFTLKTSVLGQACGLEWAVVDPTLAPFVAPKLSTAQFDQGQRSGATVNFWWARTIWEIAGLLVCILGAVLAVARTVAPGLGGSDDRVLLGVFVTSMAIFAIAKIVTLTDD